MKQINVDLDSYIHPHVPIPRYFGIRWRAKIRERDKRRCKICGTKNKIMIHHIIHKYYYPKLQFVINNGIVLCKPCEDQAHSRELNFFIPKHLKVPSLKQMIRNRPKLSWWKKFINKLRKTTRGKCIA